MTKWLLAVLKELQKVPLHTAIDNGRRMASVLTIILCFDFLIPQYVRLQDVSSEDISGMISMLALQPDLEQRKCHDYEIVVSLVDPDMKKCLTDAVVLFCNHLLQQKLLNRPMWLYAVPLLHFLRGDCQPFGNPHQYPNKIAWPDSSVLNLSTLRQDSYAGHSR